MASATLGLGKINMRQTPCIGDQLIALPQESEDSKGKANLFLCLITHHAMKTYWGNGDIAPCILNLGTRLLWWSTSRPDRFNPGERKKRPFYPLDRRLGGSYSRSGRGGEQKKSLNGYQGLFPWAQSSRDVKRTTHLYLVPRSKNEWTYTSTPLYAFMARFLV
jgi:hypothetical protein